jgi:hypothetical protein
VVSCIDSQVEAPQEEDSDWAAFPEDEAGSLQRVFEEEEGTESKGVSNAKGQALWPRNRFKRMN